jgi:hypothetical protein
VSGRRGVSVVCGRVESDSRRRPHKRPLLASALNRPMCRVRLVWAHKPPLFRMTYTHLVLTLPHAGVRHNSKSYETAAALAMLMGNVRRVVKQQRHCRRHSFVAGYVGISDNSLHLPRSRAGAERAAAWFVPRRVTLVAWGADNTDPTILSSHMLGTYGRSRNRSDVTCAVGHSDP